MDAIKALAEHCINTITRIPLYRYADMVCATPSRPEKGFDLPSEVVSIVSDRIKKEDITGHFEFGEKKPPLKSAPLDDKWDAWDESQLIFDNIDITNKKIILIDDKYQSGTTIQYVAMKLQMAGASEVYGLSMVKTMRDTDNR